MQHNHKFHRKEDGSIEIEVALRGRSLLTDGLLNKSTAFTEQERETFGLHGLIPNHVSRMEDQLGRILRSIRDKETPLEKFIGLAALQARNETLFYRLVLENIEEMLPIVYTPTVGEATKHFSRIYRIPRGVWITPDDIGRIDEILDNTDLPETKLIVVTDNERILGLGDQGAGGMGIPIGKLSLYVTAAGIHPAQTLPVSLDVGTDNQDHLNDPLYIGWRHPRLRGDAYYELVEEFVQSVKRVFPRAIIQWEDFKKANAFRLLDSYRRRHPSFNDDIQGTAAIAVAGVYAAVRIMEKPLAEQRVVILGAGAAGVGIAQQLRVAFENVGVKGDDLLSAVAVLDSRGMLVDSREIDDAYKRDFAWPAELAKSFGLDPDQPIDLKTAVEALKPTVLLGTSGQPGTFTEEIVKLMAANNERPGIFPFSNPTANSEATAKDLIEWTDGRAIVASGSPFDPVEYGGKTFTISQGNNVYIFPGVGLGAIISEASEVTDAMFTEAARALAGMVTDEDIAQGRLFPPLTELRAVSATIAAAVVREAQRSHVGRPIHDDEIEKLIEWKMWQPDYPTLKPA
ncbi:MAG: NAD-dependent malic enzyme [Myxococcota bacterium]